MSILSRLFGGGSESIQGRDAADLVEDAIDWAEERFPPPLEKFENTPSTEPLTWQIHAAAAALKVPLLRLFAEKRHEAEKAIADELPTHLDRWHARAREAYLECSAVVDDYFTQGTRRNLQHKLFSDQSGTEFKPDIAFVLGMWMWTGVYGRQPTKSEASDMYDLGRFVHASFVNYWNEGVRFVVITGDRS